MFLSKHIGAVRPPCVSSTVDAVVDAVVHVVVEVFVKTVGVDVAFGTVLFRPFFDTGRRKLVNFSKHI